MEDLPNEESEMLGKIGYFLPTIEESAGLSLKLDVDLDDWDEVLATASIGMSEHNPNLFNFMMAQILPQPVAHRKLEANGAYVTHELLRVQSSINADNPDEYKLPVITMSPSWLAGFFKAQRDRDGWNNGRMIQAMYNRLYVHNPSILHVLDEIAPDLKPDTDERRIYLVGAMLVHETLNLMAAYLDQKTKDDTSR